MKGPTRRWAAALALLLLAGCAPVGPAPAPEEKPGGTLVVYTSHREEIYWPVIKEFQERTGIWVEVEYAPTSEILDRIRREADAPRCDVIFGGGVESLEANKDCFQPYRTAGHDAIGQAFLSADDSWTPFTALPLVLIYNTRLASGDDAPTGWADLADPRWKGRGAFANPVTSGSCYTSLATALQIYGGDGWDFIRRCAVNLDGSLLENSSDITARVADGTCTLGITLEETAKRQMNAGAGIQLVYPAEGTSAVPDGTAIVSGAPHPENARLFVDFTVSRDVQEMLAADLMRRPVRTDVQPAGNLPPLGELNLIPYDFAWAAHHKDEVLARWTGLLDKGE